MTISIEILDPVYSKFSPKEDIEKILSCLSYEKEFWKPGQYRREKQNTESYMIHRSSGKFLTGLIPRIEKYCESKRFFLNSEKHCDLLPENIIPQLPGFTFREDQLEAFNEIICNQRGIIKNATGTGKTVIAGGICSIWPNSHIIFLCHTLDLLNQAYTAFTEKFGFKNVIKIGGGQNQFNWPDKPTIVIATVQTLKNFDLLEHCNWADIVIIDECFSKNTLVNTIKGKIPIEKIKINDLIYTKNKIQKVLKKFVNLIPLNRIVKINLSNGKNIICSQDHLFFTNEGWVKAKKIKNKILRDFNSFYIYDMIESTTLNISTEKKEGKNEKNRKLQYLSNLWSLFSCCKFRKKILFKKVLSSKQRKKISNSSNRNLSNLFISLSTKNESAKILLKKMQIWESRIKKNIFIKNVRNKQQKKRNYFTKNEIKQSISKSSNHRKNETNQTNKWYFKYLERRKRWKWPFYYSSNSFSNIFGMGNGSSNSLCPFITQKQKKRILQKQWIPYLLQGRYWRQKLKNWNRNRWRFTQNKKEYITGSKKDKQIKRIRVESVEIYKQGSNDKSFSSIIGNKERNQGFVELYDLEIENEHNYFVEDVLVHNCHHLNSHNSMMAEVLKKTLAPIRIGLSAELPKTEQGKLILEGYLGPVISEFNFDEGVKVGILAKPIFNLIPVPYTQEIGETLRYGNTKDKDGNLVKGMYQKGIIENKSRNRIALTETMKSINNGDSVLLLTGRDTQHGHILKEMAKDIFDLDIHFIYGDTEKQTRPLIQEMLNKKEIKCVISNVVWKEGINIPSLNHIINVGGEKYPVQIVGRGSRAINGKTIFHVTDFLDPYKYLSHHTVLRLIFYAECNWLDQKEILNYSKNNI
jgi:superfamily II DNA or RNA helicase